MKSVSGGVLQYLESLPDTLQSHLVGRRRGNLRIAAEAVPTVSVGAAFAAIEDAARPQELRPIMLAETFSSRHLGVGAAFWSGRPYVAKHMDVRERRAAIPKPNRG